ncbi:phosphatidylinositol 4-phosphate 5-kinase 1, putative [Babesia caballi]|uniref:Phosphatidylinositol 4-phosphate 5-kinase 1, putative n=1 Tax=Babesia caballi TaxID=5871 RepID=A0AAV4LX11_BABCB|nr:phosphatidylinositol 4-phosphate 5-kinase 1, putative [Babesia caballi]
MREGEGALRREAETVLGAGHQADVDELGVGDVQTSEHLLELDPLERSPGKVEGNDAAGHAKEQQRRWADDGVHDALGAKVAELRGGEVGTADGVLAPGAQHMDQQLDEVLVENETRLQELPDGGGKVAAGVGQPPLGDAERHELRREQDVRLGLHPLEDEERLDAQPLQLRHILLEDANVGRREAATDLAERVADSLERAEEVHRVDADAHTAQHAEVALAQQPLLAQVSLEAERLDGRQVRVDLVERRAGLGKVLEHVAATAGENGVGGGDAVRRAGDLSKDNGLHEARRGEQKSAVDGTPRSGDYLTSTAHGGVRGNLSVDELELGVAERLLDERTLLAGPVEALDESGAHAADGGFDRIAGQNVVEQDVGARVDVPVVLLHEEVRELAWRHGGVDETLVDGRGDALLERLRDETEAVHLVLGLGVALGGRLLHNGLGEADDGVRNLHLEVAVETAKVVEGTVEVELARAQHDVLAALLDASPYGGVAAVDAAQALNHARQLRGVERLDGDLENRLGGEEAREHAENLGAVGVVGRGDGHGLVGAEVNAGDEHPVASGDGAELDASPDFAELHVLVVVKRVRLAEHLDALPLADRPGHHPAEYVKGVGVQPVVVLDYVDHELGVWVAVLNARAYRGAAVAGVKGVQLQGARVRGRGDVLHDEVHEGAGVAKEGAENLLENLGGLHAIVAGAQSDAELLENGRELLALVGGHVGKDLVEGLQHEGDEGALKRDFLHVALRVLSSGGFVAGELLSGGVVEGVAPERPGNAGHLGVGRVEGGEGFEGEEDAVLGRGEEHVAAERAQRHGVLLHEGAGLGDELVEVCDGVADLELDGAGAAHEHVDDDDAAVADALGVGELVDEVDVPGGVEDVEEVRLVLDGPAARVARLVLEDERYRGGLDGHLARLLVQPRVRVAHEARVEALRGVGVGEAAVVDEPVHQGGLPVVEVAADADVADELRLLHERGHEVEAEAVARQSLLQNVEALGADVLVQALDVAHALDAGFVRLHDGLVDGLGVLVLDEHLDVLERRPFLGVRIVLDDVGGAEARHAFCRLTCVDARVGVDSALDSLVEHGSDVVSKLVVDLLVHFAGWAIRKMSDSDEIPSAASPQGLDAGANGAGSRARRPDYGYLVSRMWIRWSGAHTSRCRLLF